MVKGYDRTIVQEEDSIVKYAFSDCYGNDFLVVFRNDAVGTKERPMLGNSYELTYFARVGGEWSADAIVGTNVYRVVRTVLGDVLDDFLAERTWVSQIRMEGLAKEGERGKSKRTRVYVRYLEANPRTGFRVDVDGNRITLIKNKK